MKNSLLRFTLAVVTTLIITPAFAHDPVEHAKTGEAPDCESIKKMDHSKMDMNDPVMQAMMKKCTNAQTPSEKSMEGMDHGNMEGMDHNNMKGMEQSKPASSASQKEHGAY